jgi:hypothetical protein
VLTPNADPVRRWHSTQAHATTISGSPVVSALSEPQQQCATLLRDVSVLLDIGSLLDVTFIGEPDTTPRLRKTADALTIHGFPIGSY